MKEVQRVFTVNGKPFYPLGGQADNASGFNSDESETAFKAMQLIDGNTCVLGNTGARRKQVRLFQRGLFDRQGSPLWNKTHPALVR